MQYSDSTEDIFCMGIHWAPPRGERSASEISREAWGGEGECCSMPVRIDVKRQDGTRNGTQSHWLYDGFAMPSDGVADEVPKSPGKMHHRHITLEGGRTKAAQVYPDGFCRALCNGLMRQNEFDQKGQLLFAQLRCTEQE